MSGAFEAQSLVGTRRDKSKRRLEMTFVDADGQRQAISLPEDVAADLVSVLRSLTSGMNNAGRAEFTRMAKLTAVGSAEYERLVLIRFDDDPPYGLAPDEAETLWREVREQAAQVSRARRPAHQ
jgi:hypothetical protein